MWGAETFVVWSETETSPSGKPDGLVKHFPLCEKCENFKGGRVEMPNTDNSGSARAARVRRIAASRGPVPAVRPNIGSMAWDAQLGKLECCACKFSWTGSPIQLEYQKTEGTDRFFTAVFANANGIVVPAFGESIPSPCGARRTIIETLYSNNSGVLSVIYKISTLSYTPATITQRIFLTCEGSTATYSKNITFNIPEEYQTECPLKDAHQ